MARVQNAKLTLVKHDHRKDTVTLKVTYKVKLSSVERRMHGLKFKEVIKLWGNDPVVDDELYTFPIQYFNTEADGFVDRSRIVTISEDKVDEDDIPFFNLRDEVYARVEAIPLLPSTGRGKSNEIKHNF